MGGVWVGGEGGGTPSGTVESETAFGQSPAPGTVLEYSRGNHTHGTPTNPVPGHEATWNHDQIHSNSNDPSATEKAALVGTNGTPGSGNKYVTNSDPRNTDARTPTAHNLGGGVHNADTLANLNAKISDADVPALAGQLGGTPASPDVRGLRESGGQLLSIGVVTDGQYLKRNGTTIDSGSPGGGATPAWKGAIVGAWGDGDPGALLRHMQQGPDVVNPTPTNIGTTVARIAYFKLDTAIVVNKIRWYGVGAVSAIYHIAIYRNSDSVRMTADLEITTALNAWGNISAAGITLAADTLYFIAVSADITGTTAGLRAMTPTFVAATSLITGLPTAWPGNLDFDAASPKIPPYGFAQFAVTAGALPTTAPSREAQAAWVGGMPAFFLDNNNA